jgi:predicted MFS family arabinose efflux permease
MASSLVLLLGGVALFGLGNTSNLLARFAAADLAAPARRGRAIATVLLATTFGAVLGPNLVEPADELGGLLGLPPLTGPFALGVLAYALGAIIVLALLRPDPLLTAQRAAGAGGGEVPPAISLRASVRALGGPRARAGLTAMVVANLVMVAIMTMTPIHLVDHGHSLAVVGFVISAHVAGMFLPSPLTGWLCDRVGRLPVLAAGGVVLAAAGLLAASADPRSNATVAVALALLGVGWNLGLIGGSALLTDAVPPPERPQAQGAADLVMGAVGAAGSVLSGPALAYGGFAVLGLSGAVLALGLLLVVTRARALAPAAGAP